MELKRKKKLYYTWKKCQGLWKDYRVVVHICREKTCKTEVELQLKPASVLSDKKKGFLKYVLSKRRFNENIEQILVEDGHKQRLTKNGSIQQVGGFLPQSLTIPIDLGLPSPLSWRTVTAGMVTFHLCTLKL